MSSVHLRRKQAINQTFSRSFLSFSFSFLESILGPVSSGSSSSAALTLSSEVAASVEADSITSIDK